MAAKKKPTAKVVSKKASGKKHASKKSPAGKKPAAKKSARKVSPPTRSTKAKAGPVRSKAQTKAHENHERKRVLVCELKVLPDTPRGREIIKAMAKHKKAMGVEHNTEVVARLLLGL